MLEQAIKKTSASLTANTPLPSPLQSPTVFSTSARDLHHFQLPPDTAGMATAKTRNVPIPATNQPSTQRSTPLPELTATPVTTFAHILPLTTINTTPVTLPSPKSDQPTSSQGTAYYRQQYQKRKERKEAAGKIHRKYTKLTDTRICRACGEQRVQPNHKNYFGNYFCQNTTTGSYEEWKNQFGEKYKRKTTSDKGN